MTMKTVGLRISLPLIESATFAIIEDGGWSVSSVLLVGGRLLATLADLGESIDDPVNKPSVYLDGSGRAYYRMSSLGMCTKALIALRQGFTPMSPPASMQLRFNEGHLHEASILERVATEGWTEGEVFDRQDEVVVPIGTRVRLIGHIDGRGLDRLGRRSTVDAKTASDSAFKVWWGINTTADLLREFPYYWWQMGGYLAADPESMVGMFAVKCKNSGEMLVRMWPREDFPDLATIVTRVMEIERGAEEDLPVVCDKPSFPCPVWYLHEDKVEGKRGDNTFTADKLEEINALAVAYANAKAEKARTEKLEKDARAALVESLGVEIGADGKATVDPVETEAFKSVTPYAGTSAGGLDKERLMAEHPEIDLDDYKKPGTKYLAFRLTER